ncbi:MAG: hypothetical protein ABSB68_06080 [Acidimicrobiales bacterium]
MRGPRRPGGGRALATALAVAGAAVGLSACSSQGGQGLAQQACVHVNRSVDDYLRSVRAGTAATTVAQLQKEADQQLRAALPLAAQANSDDGSWNSLMTTISEGATVDEGHLVPSLRAQCVVADSNQNVNPQTPGSGTIPKDVNPKPASPTG